MRVAPRSQCGVTLVELVVTIVVIATAASAVLGVLSINAGSSADPMVRRQAVAIAQSHLEEILLKPFDDPDASDGEAARPDFDDVDDYDGLATTGAFDQFGVAIAGLEPYDVAVTVSASSALPSVAAADTLRVDVRVSRAPYVDITLSAYRTRF